MRYCLNDRTAGNWTTLEGGAFEKVCAQSQTEETKKRIYGRNVARTGTSVLRVGSIKRARPRVHLHHTGCIRGFECAAPRAFILHAAANTHSVAVSSYTGTVDSTDEQSPEERIAMWHYEDEESDGSTDEQVFHDFEDFERCMDYMDYIELQEYTAFKAFRRFKKRAM